MDKKSINELISGRKELALEPTKIILPKNIIKSKIKRWFSYKFVILVGIIDYQGSFKFYLTRIKEGILRIEGGCYRVNSHYITKTNTCYNLICFHDGNPEAITFEHNENETINSQNLTEFMDMELVGMALRVRKKTSLTMMHYLIIGGAVFVMVLVGLAMSGIIDINAFLMPPG